jgi:excisionase family DNA binding protein
MSPFEGTVVVGMNKTTDLPTPPFLTPAELAARWRITPITLRRWRHKDRIKAAFMGRGVRFSRAEIERFEREAGV